MDKANIVSSSSFLIPDRRYFSKVPEGSICYLVAAGTGTEVSIRDVKLLHAKGAVEIFFIGHHGGGKNKRLGERVKCAKFGTV